MLKKITEIQDNNFNAHLGMAAINSDSIHMSFILLNYPKKNGKKRKEKQNASSTILSSSTTMFAIRAWMTPCSCVSHEF